ncbi:MAG TPA: OmpA family protein [Roseiarcus sp.]|nr:OmpA family protein [Roseiarcus sp.]
MNDANKTSTRSQRLPGEGAPSWLVVLLASGGVALAVATAAVILPPPSEAARAVEESPAPRPPTAEEQKLAMKRMDEMLKDMESAAKKAPGVQHIQAEGAEGDCLPVMDILFPLGSAKFDAASLDRNIPLLRRLIDAHPGVPVTIEGHADATGSERNNLLLSHRRAKAVEERLASAGLSHERLHILAAGSEGARDAPAATEAVMAKDRRASIRIEGVRACANTKGATE